jgi:hypothetical protein
MEQCQDCETPIHSLWYDKSDNSLILVLSAAIEDESGIHERITCMNNNKKDIVSFYYIDILKTYYQRLL